MNVTRSEYYRNTLYKEYLFIKARTIHLVSAISIVFKPAHKGRYKTNSNLNFTASMVGDILA